MRKPRNTRWLIPGLAGMALSFGMGIALCQEPPKGPTKPNASEVGAAKPDAALGELKIEGEHLEQLILSNEAGKTTTLERPEASVKLPAGKYRVMQVRLAGSFESYDAAASTRAGLTVRPDHPAVLRIGAPLTQNVRIERKAGFLSLTYEIRGVGGEHYRSFARQNSPPQFTVYKGDRKIDSGSFEYG